jgi:hypothetical protein
MDGITDINEERIARQYRPFWDHDLQEGYFPISVVEWASLGRFSIGNCTTTRSRTILSCLN